ncbi:NADPH-dependent 7-cyano-7-deazaguanine reductase QueF [Catenovulum sp. SM1970]|uniref:NADPH-dependent 7-cyano-7-deazaguanine reductase QueF n=1 Tax=Marinifaba aquimaris TaxID=2741323 RepID=UPI0015724977|nr:NADPH-dependent 7-cyano-7-deazaguanine reductase QueF [Marinifaba aquimaris]NTS78268.1 NADPH-dependent 7-cyano-7-deazaguanine reductase QueF [Marinifaba aquimaris]
MSEKTDKNIEAQLTELTLGKETEYSSSYQPDLLQLVPRSLTRQTLGLDLASPLPFVGYDLWTGYEMSWLNSKGKPQVAIAEFKFDFSTEALVESKSFKLYLNSFNQTQFDSIFDVENTLTKDLSEKTQSQVEVQLFELDAYTEKGITSFNKSHCIDDLDIEVSQYGYDASLLHIESDNIVEQKLHSHLLKSNCLITNQPDWGSVYIEYKGKKINEASLLKYLISFRDHNEFHEHCVERIYTDLHQLLKPEKLTVYARYTRRGGLDINPIRSNEPVFMPWHRLARQ